MWSIKMTKFKAPPVASPTLVPNSLIHIHYNCIFKENALREQIIEWCMNQIISAESLEGNRSEKTLYLQVSKENLSPNLRLDSKRMAL